MSLQSDPGPHPRPAVAADAPALVDLIRAAYRGPASYERWTSEEHLVRGTRTDEQAVLGGDRIDRVSDAGRRESTARRPSGAAGSSTAATGWRTSGCSPSTRHARSRTGRQVVRWAKLFAAEQFGAQTLELEVLAQQELLRAWYERLGYAATGEIRPFPADPVFAVPMRDDLAGRARPATVTVG